MRIAELLENLRRSGIELRAQGEQLLVNAPKGAVTAEIAASIRDHKREILEFLAHAAASPTAETARIEKAPPGKPIPLSSGQQRLWYIDQLEAGTSAYNMPLALEFEGPLDVDALRTALNTVVTRHEALRTSIRLGASGEPEQVVHDGLTLEAPLVDLSALDRDAREAKCDALLVEWSRTAFDLAKAPLVHARIVRLRDTDHVLFFMPHHVVYDGLSHEIFQHELLAAYESQVRNKPLDLPALPIQYADYAFWQQGFATGKEVASHLAFWKTQLGGELPVLELPTRSARPAEQTMRGDTVELMLSAPLVDALGELGRKDGTTIFMSLLAAYNALLSRFAGQDELVVGTPIANRPHQETGGLIGFFANTLALRTSLAGDPSFREIMKRTRDVCLKSYAHQDAPFDRIVAEIKPPRDRSRTPVFQCMFSLDEQAGSEGVSAGGVRIVGHRPCGTGAARTDLTLWLRRSPHGVLGTFEYNSDLFDRAFIQQLAESYRVLLAGALRAPDAKLSELPLLDDGAREELVHTLNATEVSYPRDRALHQWFEDVARRTPSKTALRCGEASLTFAELDARANQLAHHLVSLGVSAEQRVAVCVPRSLDMVVSLLGVLKAGGAYVPLDPGYPVERLGMMLEDSGAVVLLTNAESEGVIAASVAPDVKRVRVSAEGFAQLPTTAPAVTFRPEQLAYLIYTSGSTGKPKGVMLEHRSTANFFVGMAPLLAGGGVWLNDTSISFDISVLELFGALGHGFEVVVRRELADEGESVPALIAKHGVTHFQCTPSQAGMLLVDAAGLKALSQLSQLMLGGEPLPEKLAREIKRHLRGKLVNVYGPTETTVWSTMQVLDTLTDPISIGRPIANTRLYVLDRQERLVPKGVLGELFIGGAGVARGYHGRPELTRERFVPDPFARDGSRMYRTGDLVRMRPDGTLEHRGRTDFQVKLRGHRIELGEIESALRAQKGVRDAVVSLREDVAGDPRLVGYVMAEDGAKLDHDALRSGVRQVLTEIMVPAQLVELPSFPLTPNGKVDRRALPKPQGEARAHSVQYVAPRSQVEKAICDVWRDILHVERVGIHDNFFELGGHSLRVVTMVRKLRDDHGIDLSLGTVFAAPTVAELAARAGNQPEEESESFVLPLREGGQNLPLFCICGLHLYQPLAQNLGEGQPVYGIFVPAEGHLFDGAAGEPEQFPDVAALAADYVKAVRRQQPTGPYALAGISFGGILAYEIAQQLTAQGEEVRVLALFDAILPRGVRKDAKLWLTGHLRRLAKDGPRHLFERLGALTQDHRPKAPVASGQDSQERKLEDLRERIYVRAMEQYDRDVRPYPGRAIVFRARDQSAFIGYEVDRHCGWSDLVAGGLALHHVDGDHLGILSPPYVPELARTLRSYLDQASRERAKSAEHAPAAAAVSESQGGSPVRSAGASSEDGQPATVRSAGSPSENGRPTGRVDLS